MNSDLWSSDFKVIYEIYWGAAKKSIIELQTSPVHICVVPYSTNVISTNTLFPSVFAWRNSQNNDSYPEEPLPMGKKTK
jgi:hypothetical protein